MYRAILYPLREQVDVHETIRIFWLVFAILGVCTLGALALYNKLFGEDNDSTRKRAHIVMILLYSLIIVGAFAILYFVISTKGELPVKTAIQAGIMFVIGIGGLIIILKAPGHKGKT